MEQTILWVTDIRFGVPIACREYGLKHNSNPIERYNKETGRKVDALTLFQTHMGTLSILTLCRFVYNCVSPHNSLSGKTLAEATVLDLRLGNDKLLGLVRLARKTEMMIT